MFHLLRLRFVATWFGLALILGSGGTTLPAFAQAPEAPDVSAILDKTQSSVTGIQERLVEKPQGIGDAARNNTVMIKTGDFPCNVN